MAIPLRSAEPGQPKSMQFAHFGVLNTGAQSKASAITSLVLNLSIAFVVIVISAATRQTIDNNRRLTRLTEPVIAKKVEPVKPRVVPPKPPKLPEVPKIELQPPKITVSVVKLPEAPKQPIVKMDQPKPLLIPTPPRQIIAMAAPKVVSLAHPQAASVVNHDPQPSAVRLGNPDSPISNLKGPAVASVNLARGMPGMNSANTGSGPPAAKINLGNGSPGSTSIKGNGVVAVAGIPHGVPGATGPLNATGRVAGQVNLGQATPPTMPKPAAPTTSVQRVAPKVIYKPKPEYTAEAIRLHLEGTVTVSIRVSATGVVQVLGVTSSLGHGLDEAAIRAVQATRFEPATDASGHPIVWDGVVNVAFQLAG